MKKRFIKKMKRRTVARVGAFFLVMNMMLWLIPIGVSPIKAEGDSYITEISLMQGDMSTLSLEESGYKVIEQPLNQAGTKDLYMGYKTGGEGSAIRDLIVSKNASGSIEVNGHSYRKISDISLNSGAGGPGLYLYASYDAEAGEALKGISFFVKKTPDGFSDDSPVLASDGSEVVTTAEGKVADFDEGIGDSELYLRMYKGNIYRSYVEKVIVATASSDEAAIAELAAKRCTYYVNYDIGEEKPVYVGYTRTDDEKKALRALVAIGGNADQISSGKEGTVEINGVPYTSVDGGEVNAEKKYTFYMTGDERAGEPVIDLVACGYDPEELGLKNLNKDSDQEEPQESEEPEDSEEPQESEEPEKTEETEETGEPENDKDDPGDPGGQEDTDDGEGDDEAETVSDRISSERALGMLCVVGMNPVVTSETLADEPKNEGSKLAKAYRVYSEMPTKEWVSGYYLRGGGQTASKYLYDEDNYISASNSDEKLWLSNIYCSDKKGRQFTNCIGYVSRPGEAETDPFEVTVAYDKAEKYAKNQDDAESTASVFGMNIGQVAMFSMIFVIMAGIIISLGYKLHKNNKDGRKEP